MSLLASQRHIKSGPGGLEAPFFWGGPTEVEEALAALAVLLHIFVWTPHDSKELLPVAPARIRGQVPGARQLPRCKSR